MIPVINRIVEIIKDNFNPEKIILFGSYAYGIPNENSDIDLLVIVKTSPQPRYKRAGEIRKYIFGLTDIPKDILVYTESEVEEWKNVQQSFITSIFNHGVVMYENKK
jgi:uncharacterized protein